jgi:pimeloyl-ACP methyl ester carboxylesterase
VAILHHEVTGDGPVVVLLHPGFADSRIWEPQWRSWSDRFRLVRFDFPGYGRSPIGEMPLRPAHDVLALFGQLGIEQAMLVGASFGGGVALELAVARPELVSALVLVGAATPEAEEAAPEVAEYVTRLETAFEDEGVDAAVETAMRMWVDGPERSPGQVDPDVRAAIAAMQRDAFVNMDAVPEEEWSQEQLVTGLHERLGEISVPTLVVVGELDQPFIRAEADVFASRIAGALLEVMAGTAHAPSIERPEQFDALVLPFLARDAPSR